tara:strand:- start:378 stop:710 length:333 start_codon:yes stop_codon:yes gene_type:complete
MVDISWGKKRVCSCGKIRFYDLNKKKIECPECGEIIDISFLETSTVDKGFLNKDKTADSPPPKKEKEVEKENKDVEKEKSFDIDDTSKMPVKEIIGDTSGKNPTNIKEEE